MSEYTLDGCKTPESDVQSTVSKTLVGDIDHEADDQHTNTTIPTTDVAHVAEDAS